MDNDEKLLDFINSQESTLLIWQMEEATGLNRQEVNASLRRLRAADKITRVDMGEYQRKS